MNFSLIGVNELRLYSSYQRASFLIRKCSISDLFPDTVLVEESVMSAVRNRYKMF